VTTLDDIAARDAIRDMRDISTCWQYSGWHAKGAGPCFDTYEMAVAYRDWLESMGRSWASEEDRVALGWYRGPFLLVRLTEGSDRT
jgi:hypothetical protein